MLVLQIHTRLTWINDLNTKKVYTIMKKGYRPGTEFNTNMYRTGNLASYYIPTILDKSLGVHAERISTGHMVNTQENQNLGYGTG